MPRVVGGATWIHTYTYCTYHIYRYLVLGAQVFAPIRTKAFSASACSIFS